MERWKRRREEQRQGGRNGWKGIRRKEVRNGRD